MRVAVGADHAGYSLKAPVLEALRSWGHEVEDLGAHSAEPVDFPDVVLPVCDAVLEGRAERGILVCGTGIGACMAANKVAGIRAALTHDTYSAERAALSNDAHIITMGARVIGPEVAKSIADSFLAHTFDQQGRSAPNVKAIDEVEAKYAKA